MTEPLDTQPTTPAAPPPQQPASSRISAWWVGLILAAIVLILLLVFIGQNSQDVTVRYLGFHGQVSLAIALLLSAIAGVLLVAIPGTARILQLRRALARSTKARAAGSS